MQPRGIGRRQRPNRTKARTWGSIAVAAIIVMLSVLVLTIVIQREIVQGLSAGGVK